MWDFIPVVSVFRNAGERERDRDRARERKRQPWGIKERECWAIEKQKIYINTDV